MTGEPMPQPQPFTTEELVNVQAWCWATSNENGQWAGALGPVAQPSIEEFRSKETFYARLAATLAELEQLRQDKERLDWLNGRGSEFEGMTAATPPRETVWFFKSAEHSDLRAAIDAGLASRSLPGALKEEKDNG